MGLASITTTSGHSTADYDNIAVQPRGHEQKLIRLPWTPTLAHSSSLVWLGAGRSALSTAAARGNGAFAECGVAPGE